MHPHLGNRSTNRVEGAHAGLKAILSHSGGNMDKAFESIDKWYRGMVRKKEEISACELFHISIHLGLHHTLFVISLTRMNTKPISTPSGTTTTLHRLISPLSWKT
jgi:hypothetical protein